MGEPSSYDSQRLPLLESPLADGRLGRGRQLQKHRSSIPASVVFFAFSTVRCISRSWVWQLASLLNHGWGRPGSRLEAGALAVPLVVVGVSIPWNRFFHLLVGRFLGFLTLSTLSDIDRELQSTDASVTCERPTKLGYGRGAFQKLRGKVKGTEYRAPSRDGSATPFAPPTYLHRLRHPGEPGKFCMPCAPAF